MSPPGDLPCVELVELITDYLEGALPPAEERRFEDHLAGCQGCQRYLDQMHRTVGVLRALREDDIHPVMRARLLAAFRTWKRG